MVSIIVFILIYLINRYVIHTLESGIYVYTYYIVEELKSLSLDKTETHTLGRPLNRSRYYSGTR